MWRRFELESLENRNPEDAHPRAAADHAQLHPLPPGVPCGPDRGGNGILRSRSRCRSCARPSPFRRGAAHLRHGRSGDSFFHFLQPEVPLLPELPDQPRQVGCSDGSGGPGGRHAGAGVERLPQHRAGDTHAADPCHPGITSRRHRVGPSTSDRIQLRRV